MTLTINNHFIDSSIKKPSPNHSGEITPKFIVMHYTAGWSAEGSITWLTNKESKVSAHLVIARDGTITQLVPFNKKAWHAGPSVYDGYKNLNSHSIGIALDNAGWVEETS